MRYSRQTQLAEIGLQGQEKLHNARVLVVGAGGLGCHVLPLLVGAGVGFIRLYDADIVDETNLHRQTLYRMQDIGRQKVQAAANTLHDLNPTVQVEMHAQRLYVADVDTALQGIDLVVDAADNFVTTYLLSDACLSKNIPLISASVIRREGYVGAFCAGVPSYRALFPRIPQQVATCNTQGVMGSAVAVLGAMQAQMALSVLLDFQPSVLGQLFKFDFNTWQTSSMTFHLAEEPTQQSIMFIDTASVTASDYVVELRSEQEKQSAPSIDANVELTVEQSKQICCPEHSKRLVLVCRQGIRALNVAQHLYDTDRATQVAVLAMGD